MTEKFQIRAGYVSEICKDKGDWLFVDVGFSNTRKSCGVLKPDGTADTVTFGALKRLVIKEAQKPICTPLNLVLEAPLSVAFNQQGNPTRRKCDTWKDKDGREKHRDAYVNAGATTLTGANFLLRSVFAKANGIKRPIRLFEGFLSFKSGTSKSDHIKDAKKLREVAWSGHGGKFYGPQDLQKCSSDTLELAFDVPCKDFGIPPVIFVYPSP